MPIRNDSDALPLGSVIRIKRTNEFAIIRKKTFQKDGKGFLNYLVEIEDKEGLYCAFHDDIDLEHLPPFESRTGLFHATRLVTVFIKIYDGCS